MSEKHSVSVCVRVRPFNRRELGDTASDIPTSIVACDSNGKTVTLLSSSGEVEDTFQYHRTFWSMPPEQQQVHSSAPFASQEDVFRQVGEAPVQNAWNGYHSCVLAYGQTGSGKTHTMLGTPADPGIAPQLIRALFTQLEEKRQSPHTAQGWEYSTQVSFMEIYNERVKDLLTEVPGGLVRRNRSHASMSPSAGSSPLAQLPDDACGTPEESDNSCSPRSDGPSVTKVRSRSGGRRGRRPRGATTASPPRARIADSASPRSARIADTSGYAELRVRHSKETGTYVEGLTRFGDEHAADGHLTAQEVIDVMQAGMTHRAQAATAMNDTSSRSHAIFQICLTGSCPSRGLQRYAHINLVDLAGSERLKMSKSEGQALKEATRINLSLSTLRRVIDVLIANAARRKKPGQSGYLVPPYRDSLLTWILSESLGGNSKTTMIATVSPHDSNREDTQNTLRYALKAKSVVNSVRINDTKTNVVLSAMQTELQTLKAQLSAESAIADDVHVLREREKELAEQAEEKAAEAARMQEDLEHQQQLLNFRMQARRRMSIDNRQLRTHVLEEYDEIAADEARAEGEAYKAARRLSHVRRDMQSKSEEVERAAAERAAADEEAARALEEAACSYDSRLVARCQTWRLVFQHAIRFKERADERADVEELNRKWHERSDHMSMESARTELTLGEVRSLCGTVSDRVARVNADFDRRYAPGGVLDDDDGQRNAIREASAEGSFLIGSSAGELHSEQKRQLRAHRECVQETARAAQEAKLRADAVDDRLASIAADRRRAASVSAADAQRLQRLRSMLAAEQKRAEKLGSRLGDLQAELAACNECAAAVVTQNEQLTADSEATGRRMRELRADSSRLLAEGQALTREQQQLSSHLHNSALGLDTARRRRHRIADEAGARGLQHRDLRKFTEIHFFADDKGMRPPSHGEQRRAETSAGSQFEGHREWIRCGYRYRSSYGSPAQGEANGSSARRPSPARQGRLDGPHSAPQRSPSPALGPADWPPCGTCATSAVPTAPPNTTPAAPPVLLTAARSESSGRRRAGPSELAWQDGPVLARRVALSGSRQPPPQASTPRRSSQSARKQPCRTPRDPSPPLL